MRTLQTLLIVSSALIFSLGCTKYTMDWESGKDKTRKGAKPVKLNEVLNDSLDAGAGDHSDWRQISLKKKGSIQIVVVFDTPEKIRARVRLTNAFGSTMREKSQDQTSNREVSMGPYYLDKGDYFLLIQSTKGASVYSLKVIYKAGGVDVEKKVPRPE